VTSFPDRDRRRIRSAGDSAPLRLLIAEDDANYLAYVAGLAQRLGFLIDTAPDGAAASEQLARGTYDVAVIDQAMPRLTGTDVIEQLRALETTRSMYALMLTAREDVDTRIAALDAGFDDVMTKSASEDELLAKLAAARRVASRQRTADTAVRELYGLAMRDELTTVFNRRFFAAEAERMLAREMRLSIVLFDLDSFKAVNDTYGHLAGDRVLRDVGLLFQNHTRPDDLVARYGGDEFVMAVAGLEVEEVQRLAARVAAEIAALQWLCDERSFRISATTGFGSSALLQTPTLEQLIDAADRDLYKNKWIRTHPTLRPELYEYPAQQRADRILPLPAAVSDSAQNARLTVTPSVVPCEKVSSFRPRE
jgi:diguanylate cyclase (GGDEF)-like protein